MLLQFITEPKIGAKERRQIRSHVMQGKNAGKPRIARSKLIHCDLQPSREAGTDASGLNVLVELDSKHTLSLHRLLWNDVSLTTYPYRTSPETDKFVYQHLWTIAKALYPPAFCLEVDLAQYAWFQYALSDLAYFHCFLAIASSFPTHFGGPRLISPAALKHISHAYRLTNAQLSGTDACSDNAIAVVSMLAIYQRIHHQHAIGLVHFAGLRRMIGLRGGLSQLGRENRGVAQKPWRLAIEFAVQDGEAVGFDVPSSLAVDFVHRSPRVMQRLVAAPEGLDLCLRGLFVSVTAFTHLLDSTTTTDSKLNHLDYSDAVCLRLHRLLEYAPLATHLRPCLSPLDDLVHLTLVAVITTLMPEYGHNQARYDLLADELRRSLKKYAEIEGSKCKMFLWALFVGNVTVLDGSDRPWLVSTAGTVAAGLHFNTWMEARTLLSTYAWIGVIYDKAGSELWLATDVGKQGE